MNSPFLGELLGTMMLMILGDGVVAAVLLSRSKAENSGWIVITTGWAFAVMMGVFTAGAFGSSFAHINPAVTIGFAVAGNFPWAQVPLFIVAQLIGAFIGAVVVWLAYLAHWEITNDEGLKLAVFSTAPAVRNFGLNTITEAIGTFVLVFGVAAIFSTADTAFGAGFSASGIPTSGLAPFLVGALVWGIGLSLGGPTGYAINPARDLGPRIAHAILPIAGKGESDWAYSWVPVVGPILGGALAGLLIIVLS